MRILAFGHKSGVGKDTAAGFLTTCLRMRKQNINVQQVSFASLLKRVTYEMFKWASVKPEEYYEKHREARTEKIPDLNMDIVELWVAVGETMNKIHEKVWVNSLFENHKNADILIIRDMRRVPEADAVTAKQGLKFRIVKADATVRNTVSDNYLNDYTDWTETIENNGSLNLLYENMNNLIDKYRLLG